MRTGATSGLRERYRATAFVLVNAQKLKDGTDMIGGASLASLNLRIGDNDNNFAAVVALVREQAFAYRYNETAAAAAPVHNDRLPARLLRSASTTNALAHVQRY